MLRRASATTPTRYSRKASILHPIHWRRGNMNPVRLLAAVLETRRVYRSVRPDLVHHVAVVPTLIGSMAALGLPIVRLNALAGLGFAFTSDTAKARIVRPLARLVLGWLLKRPNTAVLVQNPDDYALVEGLGVPKQSIALIPGSGVDVDVLTPLPEPAGPFTVGYVGRLLDDKGVRTLVRAHELLAQRGIAVNTLLAGEPDPSNPASIPDHVLASWQRIPESPASRPCGRHTQRLGSGARCRSPVEAGGPAKEPAGSGRLRPAFDRYGRSRLPGNCPQ